MVLDAIGIDADFLIKIGLCLCFGLIIGAGRERANKPAGISTHSLVIGGSMLFTILSLTIDPQSTSRIAAQIVTGVGFLGAGIIMRDNNGLVRNLTTAASIWFSAAIGMLVGYGFYGYAVIAVVFAVVTPLIPHVPVDHEVTLVKKR
ncbi:MAG TPA: MgtC/SapB family protein [Acidobacteriota bacterium]|nr:MgtC/SapB family protein [Acidobacteriota bacterium]